MERIKAVDEKAADIYRYMNFDQIDGFRQAAAMVA